MSVDITRSLQDAADGWVRERDELIELIRYRTLVGVDGAREIADAILAAGWRNVTEREDLARMLAAQINAQPADMNEGVYVDDDDLSGTCIDGWVDLLAVADAVLAGGWRKVEPTCDHHYVRALPSVAYCDRCGRQRFAAEGEDLPLPPTPEETMQMMLDQIARERPPARTNGVDVAGRVADHVATTAVCYPFATTCAMSV
jgi:IS5 family transposase